MCYRCGEKFFQDHKCSQKQFKAIIAETKAGLDIDEDEAADDIVELNEKADESREGVETKISLNALIGRRSCSTMCIAGQIRGQHMLILIDSDSIHNFLSTDLIK